MNSGVEEGPTGSVHQGGGGLHVGNGDNKTAWKIDEGELGAGVTVETTRWHDSEGSDELKKEGKVGV